MPSAALKNYREGVQALKPGRGMTTIFLWAVPYELYHVYLR